MDERKRRNFIFGFGGVAIVIAAVVVVWGPNFPPEKASGAIGAVEKHHETQISAKDVILGDEATRQSSKYVFADYLADAVKLQSISTSLGSADLANRDQIENISQELQSHEADLGARYASAMTDTLNAMEALLNRDGASLGAKDLQNINAELQSIETELNARMQNRDNLGAKVENRENLGAKVENRDNLGSRMANRDTLGARSLDPVFVGSHVELNSQQMDALNNRLEAIVSDLQSKNFFSKNLGSAEQQLESAVADLQSKTLGNSDVLGAVAKLGHVADQLNDKAMLGVSIANRVEYLNAVEMQSKVIANVERDLASRIGNAADLQSHIGSFVESLGSEANSLESHALGNMEERLGSETEMASRIANMETMLGMRFNRESLESKTLGSFDAALANVSKGLNNLSSDLQSHVALNSQAELASISEHLNNVADLQSKTLGSRDELGSKNLGSRDELGSKNLGSRDQLGSKNLGSRDQLGSKNLGSRDQLGSKNLGSRDQLGSRTIGNRDTLASFDKYLGSMSEALQSKNLGSKLSNRQEFANQARDLQNRTSDLQSRNQ